MEKRKAISAQRRAEVRSMLPSAFALDLGYYSGWVMSFVSIGSEIETDLLNIAIGKRLLLPRVVGVHLEAYSPHEERVLDPKEIEFIIVPGVAFDAIGSRLGYGKGYYDRFLPSAPEAVKLGLSFMQQKAVEIPVEEHDVEMDSVLWI